MRIAFYGTLMSTVPPLPGAPDRAALVEVLGPCVLRGTLLDLGDYPALAPGKGRVVGELCRVVSAEALAALDAWEDYAVDDEPGSEYVRRRVRLLDPDEECWTYEFNRAPDGFPGIEDGDWAAHLRRRGGAAADAARWT